MYKPLRSCAIALAALLTFSPAIAYGWHAKTHKYLAQRAVEFLGDQEREFYGNHKDDLFRGVVEADSSWGNTSHHITFYNDGEIKSDVAADYAEEFANRAVAVIHDARRRGQVTQEDQTEFARLCGYVVHVITDVGNAFHVIWGENQGNHGKYESSVDDEIAVAENGDFESRRFKINFDGKLKENVDPYEAVMEVARATYFGTNGLTAEEVEGEMELADSDPENWSAEVERSTRMTMRKATNVAAEVLDELHKRAFSDPLEDVSELTETLQTKTLDVDEE